jgi:hypothetical protein
MASQIFVTLKTAEKSDAVEGPAQNFSKFDGGTPAIVSPPVQNSKHQV